MCSKCHSHRLHSMLNYYVTQSNVGLSAFTFEKWKKNGNKDMLILQENTYLFALGLYSFWFYRIMLCSLISVFIYSFASIVMVTHPKQNKKKTYILPLLFQTAYSAYLRKAQKWRKNVEKERETICANNIF